MKKTTILCLLFSVCALAENTAEIKKLAAESLLLSIAPLQSGFVAVGERGHVLISQDQGKSWQQAAGVPTRATMTKVATQGSKVWVVGHDTTIIHSADGGKTWNLQFEDAPREVPLLSVLFLDESRGFAVGAYGTLLSTTDGGMNWDDGLISEELDYHLNDLVITDSGVLVAAAEAGYMFRSEDAGATWQEVELPYPGSMFGLQALGGEIVTYGLRGHVLQSLDGGSTWTEIHNPTQDNLFGSIEISDDELVLLGANGARLRYQNATITPLTQQDSGDDYASGVKAGNDLILIGEAGISTHTINH